MFKWQQIHHLHQGNILLRIPKNKLLSWTKFSFPKSALLMCPFTFKLDFIYKYLSLMQLFLLLYPLSFMVKLQWHLTHWFTLLCATVSVGEPYLFIYFLSTTIGVWGIRTSRMEGYVNHCWAKLALELENLICFLFSLGITSYERFICRFGLWVNFPIYRQNLTM